MVRTDQVYLENVSEETFTCESFMKFYNAALRHKMISYKRKDSGHCVPRFLFVGDFVMSRCYCINLSNHFNEFRNSWMEIIPKGMGSNARRIELGEREC